MDLDEKILKWFMYFVFGAMIIGGGIYFLTFVFMLLKEVKGFEALVVIATAIVCICSVTNILKRF